MDFEAPAAFLFLPLFSIVCLRLVAGKIFLKFYINITSNQSTKILTNIYSLLAFMGLSGIYLETKVLYVLFVYFYLLVFLLVFFASISFFSKYYELLL